VSYGRLDEGIGFGGHSRSARCAAGGEFAPSALRDPDGLNVISPISAEQAARFAGLAQHDYSGIGIRWTVLTLIACRHAGND
jgi:hypothetical protein